MTTIYGIKNCSTMKKAFDKLKDLDVEYEFFDYKKQPISVTTIQTWVSKIGLEKVLNKKGTTYRNLTNDQKQSANDEQHAIGLMAKNPSMIKRPIIEYEKSGEMHYIAGFDEQTYEAIYRQG